MRDAMEGSKPPLYELTISLIMIELQVTTHLCRSLTQRIMIEVSYCFDINHDWRSSDATTGQW